MKNTLFFFSFLFVANFLSAQQDSLEYYSKQEILDKIIAAETNQNYEDALKWIDKVNENDSLYNSLLTSKAMYLLELERYAEVIELCDEELKKNNEYAYYFYLNKGIAYERMEKYQKAINTYTEAIKKYPLQHLLFYNRGLAYKNLKKYQKAVDDFKQAIEINPFHPNSHLQLGIIAYQAKNLAETMLCLNTYLYVNPTSENSLNVLSWLNTNVASENKEEKINVIISKDDKAFDEINVLLENYVALQKKYKVKNKIKLDYVKQNHLLFEQLKNFEGNNGFFSRTYVPFYKSIFQNGQFDNFIYYISQSLPDDNKYKKVVAANKGNIKSFVDWSINKFYQYFNTKEITVNGNKISVKYWIKDSKYVSAIGNMDLNTGIKTGYWQYYFSAGNKKSEGYFDENGKRTGRWVWYFQNGKINEIAYFKDDLLDGKDTIFHKNGNINKIIDFKEGKKEGNYYEYSQYGGLIEHSVFKDGKANGKTIINYEIGEGFVHYDANQKDNKIEGELLEKYDSGELLKKTLFKENIREGESISYYRNGKVSEKLTYVEGKSDGDYIAYYDDGKIYQQGKYKEGTAVGEWVSYYRNGNKKVVINYDEKGKLNGHYVKYDYDGKIHYELDYLKGDLVAYKFYDKEGNIIKESKKSKGKFLYQGFNPDGSKRAEGYYKYQGGKEGEWKFYDKNGVLSSIEHYKDGKLDGTVVSYYASGKVYRRSNYKDDQKDGYFVEFHPNGKMARQGYYKNGRAQGVWLTYYIDGTLSQKNYFANDLVQGKQYYYAPDGKLSSISIYHQDKELQYINIDNNGNALDTLWYDDKQKEKVIHYPNHKIRKKGHYLNGFAHGKHTWYYFNGKVDTEGEYFNDNRHGTWKWYNENGTLKTEGTYYYGDKHGEWKNYYDNGQLENVETFYYDNNIKKEIGYNENGTVSYEIEFYYGMRHGEQRLYSNNGELQLIRYYDYGKIKGYSYLGKNGKPVPMIPITSPSYKVVSYFSNGNKAREYEVTNGQFDKYYKKYAKNGTLVDEEVYKNGNLIGEAKEYYNNGKLKSVKPYNEGYLNGTVKEYYDNGKLKAEKEYRNGEEHGTWTFYDKTGKKIKTQTYFDGMVMDEQNF